MLIVVFIISLTSLSIMYDYSALRVICQSGMIAVMATMAELLSKKGRDTITIPVIVSLVCLIFDMFF